MQFLFEVFLLKNNMIYDVTDWRAKQRYSGIIMIICGKIYFHSALSGLSSDIFLLDS